MSQGPVAYLNGRFIPAGEAKIDLADVGFVLGATATEQLRTFGGRLFRLEEHLSRLAESLAIIEATPEVSLRDIGLVAIELAARNCSLLEQGDDLGLAILVTPGSYASFAEGREFPPTVCLHTYPLPFHAWAEKYATGQSLATTPVEQVSPRSWPRRLKCRSRMHFYLADLSARRIDPQARALLLDADGTIVETATANVLLYEPEVGLISPPREQILPGISLATAGELAREAGIALVERPIMPADALAAAEVLLCSTPYCLLPVVRLNGRQIGAGRPGEAFEQLITSWGRQAGIDIRAQADRFFSARRFRQVA